MYVQRTTRYKELVDYHCMNIELPVIMSFLITSKSTSYDSS